MDKHVLPKIDATNCAPSTNRAIHFTAPTDARQTEVRRATWDQFSLETAVCTRSAAHGFRSSFKDWARQLVGYFTRDCNDAFALTAVGFYSSGQAEWIRWPLPDAIQRTTVNSGAILKGVRDEFRAFVHRHSRYGGTTIRKKRRKSRRSVKKAVRRRAMIPFCFISFLIRC